MSAFVQAVKSMTVRLRQLLSIKSNRASIRQAALYSVIAHTIQTEAPLSSTYWVTIEEGEQLHIVLQHLIANKTVDPKALDPALIVALSGAGLRGFVKPIRVCIHIH